MHYLIVMTGDFWGVFFVLYVPGISLHSTVCSYLLWHLVFSFFSSVFFFLYVFLSFFEWEVCHAFKSKYGKILTVNSQIRAANISSSCALAGSIISRIHLFELIQKQLSSRTSRTDTNVSVDCKDATIR